MELPTEDELVRFIKTHKQFWDVRNEQTELLLSKLKEIVQRSMQESGDKDGISS